MGGQRAVRTLCKRCAGRTVAPGCRRTFTSSAARRRSEQVRIVEVGPRDGLQNEKTSIPAATKIELVRRLATTGVDTIEAGAFVSPKWVPQMANSSQILESILQDPPSSRGHMTYQWLMPNNKGLDNFLSAYTQYAPSVSSSSAQTFDAGPSSNTSTQDPNEMPSSTSGVDAMLSNRETSPPAPRHEISLFMAATETFSQRNTNCSVADSLYRFRDIVNNAKSHNLDVRAYISVALGCPYEGPDVDPHRVAEICAELLEMGADEISVADTTGMGTPPRTQTLLKTLQAAGIKNEDLALHFHDTYGQALVNALVALEHGIGVFDSAVGGLGGCPFSPGATGNVATEDLVNFFEGLGIRTGVDLEEMAQIGRWISEQVGRQNESRAGRATLAKMSAR